MRRKCIVCGRDAIIYVPYARSAFCREHFERYYERRIARTLKEHGFRGGRVLVALSGGKDSVALLAALVRLRSELNIEVEAVHVNLHIHRNQFSDVSLDVSKRVCEALGVRLHVIDLKETTGLTLPELVSASARKPCSVCGLVRRYLLNRFAWERGFDWIATGHNMDDACTFMLKALLTERLEDIARAPEVVTPPRPELRLVGRIRPQLFTTARENRTYVAIRGLPVVEVKCPYSEEATLHKYMKLWEHIVRVNPVSPVTFLRTVLRIKRALGEDAELRQCSRCGFATTGDVCAFCRLMERVRRET